VYNRKKNNIMTTISLTLENPSLVSSLKKLLTNINGVTDFKVTHQKTAALVIPNRTTQAAIKEIRNGGGVKCKNVEDLFEKLNA